MNNENNKQKVRFLLLPHYSQTLKTYFCVETTSHIYVLTLSLAQIKKQKNTQLKKNIPQKKVHHMTDQLKLEEKAR